jgi:hypothetical protein
MIKKLLIFERKIMRKIFGPTKTDDGYWRIKTNQEISDILKGQNIIGFIKKQRLNWLGHVERMTEDNNVKKIKRWKPMSKRPTGRPKLRWEDDVLGDIRNTLPKFGTFLLGHLVYIYTYISTDSVFKEIKRWKPMSKRPIGRPKLRWEDDVLGDIKSMNVRNWKNLAQDKEG